MNQRLGKYTILLVEDNPDHAFLAKEGLNKSGFENLINVVEDGQEALDYLFRQGKYTDSEQYPMPELILLDIKLPKKTGIEVLKEIKTHEELKKIPIIMLTSSKRDEDIVDSYAYGANSYITKPMNFNEFTKAMMDLQLYWYTVNTLPPK